MASIEPTKFTVDSSGKKRAARDSKWVARWRSPDGRSREKSFDRKIDAEQHLTAVEHSKLTGAYVDPRAGRITFKTYAEKWRASQVHRAGTASQIETNLRRHVYPRIGERPIGAIRPSELQACVKAMSVGDVGQKPLAPSTIEIVYTWVATIFAAAMKDRVITSSPCQDIRRPEVHQPRVKPLPVETVEKLIDAVPAQYRALIVLGAGTGVRISEALGLTNDRVDWMRRTVTIDRQLVGVGEGGALLFGPLKDKKNRPRTIPLPQVVIDELSAHVARYGLGPEGLLFTGWRGGALRRTAFSNMWAAAAGPLGIPSGDGYHQLRHFYASLLIRHGESVKVVQERLGHTSAQMTLDIYSHLWPEDEDHTRAAIDGVLGAGRGVVWGSGGVSDGASS
jgi:integrase